MATARQPASFAIWPTSWPTAPDAAETATVSPRKVPHRGAEPVPRTASALKAPSNAIPAIRHSAPWLSSTSGCLPPTHDPVSSFYRGDSRISRSLTAGHIAPSRLRSVRRTTEVCRRKDLGHQASVRVDLSATNTIILGAISSRNKTSSAAVFRDLMSRLLWQASMSRRHIHSARVARRTTCQTSPRNRD